MIVSHPASRKTLNKSKQLFLPTEWLTKPEISAPINWPKFRMLAIQAFSDNVNSVVELFGRVELCGNQIPLNA